MHDVQSKDGTEWFYSETVKKHFFAPQNLAKTKEESEKLTQEADGIGEEGSPACLSGETMIAVADGRNAVKIIDLVKENKEVPIYCFDGENIVVRFARNVRKTKEKSPIIKINLDNNTFFKATADHKIMLRTGEYKQVRDLNIGDSLMPFNKVIRAGYFYVYLNNGTRKKEHELIYDFYYPSKRQELISPNIHHIDSNKLNNNILNLKLLPAEEHARLHSIVHKNHLNGIVRDIKGNNNPMRLWWNNTTSQERELYKLNMSFATSGNKNGRWKKIPNEKILELAYEYFILGKVKLTNKNWRIFAKKSNFPQCVDPRFNKFNDFKEQVVSYNHRVSSIEFGGYEDVYNMTVDDFNNYAIITNNDNRFSGIISRNCGDMMKMWIKVKDNKIIDCKWQTFGCASAIASTSMFSVMITEKGGMEIEKALEIKPQDIAARLQGLPARKFHCSVLADKALRAAINDYYLRTKQLDKIKKDSVKIVDKILKITDHDIEEAVLDGARTFEDLQKRTKIGIQDKTCIPEAEQLLRFYIEKYNFN